MLDVHWDGMFPVKLQGITNQLGATVYREALPPELSGFIIKNTDEPARIVLNSNEPDFRQRFTWAHELGHLVERMAVANDQDFSFVDARSMKYDLHEFFADEFAGALLIPYRELQLRREEGWTIPRLAEHFGVSIPAVQKRLDRLAKRSEALTA